jgi:prolyl-tRNA synthetase
MGGSQSQEFMVYTDAGEDLIASCPVCGYAANLEKGVSRLDPVDGDGADGRWQAGVGSTPGCAAIADVAEFFKISPASTSSAWRIWRARSASKGGKPDTWHGVAAFLRGDHQVNETKLLGAIKGVELRTMQAEELTQYFNGPAGFWGRWAEA